MNHRLRNTFAVSIVVISVMLGGCSSPSSELAPQTSEGLQARVVMIADLAAAGDHATALSELAVLHGEAAEARASGAISLERARTIEQSIALVRADLEAAMAVPVPAPTEQPVVTDPAPDTSDPNGNGNSGGNDNGDDNGNGKGNEKGDGKGKGTKP